MVVGKVMPMRLLVDADKRAVEVVSKVVLIR
jgi:hypothetical protein